MKKPIFYLILFTSLAFAASAKQLSQRQACSKAQQFVRSNSRLKNLSATDLQLAYTQTTSDNSNIPDILGTIAGDDTIFIVIKEGVSEGSVIDGLSNIIDIR